METRTDSTEHLFFSILLKQMTFSDNSKMTQNKLRQYIITQEQTQTHTIISFFLIKRKSNSFSIVASVKTSGVQNKKNSVLQIPLEFLWVNVRLGQW